MIGNDSSSLKSPVHGINWRSAKGTKPADRRAPRDLPLWVELTRSPQRRGMTAACAFETFEYVSNRRRPCEKAMFKSLCGSAVEFAGGLDFHMERGSGGPHSLDERLHPEDGDHPLQIVGENVKAHLRADLFEGAQPEVGRAHPRLDGSEWMF